MEILHEQRIMRWTKVVGLMIAGIAVTISLSVGSPGIAVGSPIRLGWQVPWATQGQLVMGLKHTNIPQIVGIDLVYVGFNYGGPLNRAALAGEIDVLLTADQPALVLLSKSDSFRIVARMMYNRVCLYVRPDSSIRSPADVAGKRVMGPIGAAAERVVMAKLRDEGVDLESLAIGQLDMAQQSALLRRAGTQGELQGVDALFGFDPLPAVFEVEGLARMIHCGKVVSLVLASKSMVEERRNELEAFLRGFALSWAWFARESKMANQWFSIESRLNVGDDVLDKAASIEPNRWVDAIDDLRLSLSESDYEIIDEAHQFLRERGIIKEALDIRQLINLEPLQASLRGPDLESDYASIKSSAPN